MAPIRDSILGLGPLDDKKDEEDEQNIWSTILSQVEASSHSKLPSCKVLLVMGDNESGKTSLVARLQGNEDPKKGSGLEYHYLVVRDEYRDDHTRLGVWVLDGDPWHRNLLKFVLNEQTFPHTTVLLTASMAQPWDIMESLENWATILEEHVDRLKIAPDTMESYKQKTLKRFQDYIEPGDELEGITSPLRKSVGDIGAGLALDDDIVLQLGENVLTRNIGLDIVVAVTKTDYMSTLEKEFSYKDEHFDFVQQALRKFCLRYGASLFYTSVKEDKNCDLLYKYLVHRIYGFPFKTPALVVEKDAVFIPSGWDNDKKIAILYENLTTVNPDDNYSDIVIKPVNVRKFMQREPEVTSEDDQVFLLRQQGLLNQQAPPAGRPQESPVRAPTSVQKTTERRLSGSPSVQTPTKKIEAMKGATGSEGMLQNFFNSLLNRKTGPTGAAMRVPDKAAVRADGTALYDQINRTNKPTLSSNALADGTVPVLQPKVEDPGSSAS